MDETPSNSPGTLSTSIVKTVRQGINIDLVAVIWYDKVSCKCNLIQSFYRLYGYMVQRTVEELTL